MSHEKPSSSRICSSMEEIEKMKQDLIDYNNNAKAPSDAEKEFRENLKKSKESLVNAQECLLIGRLRNHLKKILRKTT